MGFSRGPKIVTDGLVLCLDAANKKSYSGSGTTWTDLSGQGNNGTLQNGPTFDSGNKGSLIFDYTNDYVSTNGMSNFTYTSGITVLVWHYNGGGTGYYRGVVTNGVVGERQGGFDLRYGREDYFGGSNNGTNLRWRITNSNDIVTSIAVYANVNEWHCYVCTYDNQLLKVYKDGQLFDSTTHSAGGQLKTMNGSTTIGLSPGTSEYLDGKLAVTTIYNRALTATEVLQNYNATKTRFGL